MAPPADLLTPWPSLADPDHILRPSRPSTTRSAAAACGGPTTPGQPSSAAGRSVFARVPSANTHLAVIALAERLAARFAGAGEPGAPLPTGATGAT